MGYCMMHCGFDLAISAPRAVRSGVQSKLRGSAKPLTIVLDASLVDAFWECPVRRDYFQVAHAFDLSLVIIEERKLKLHEAIQRRERTYIHMNDVRLRLPCLSFVKPDGANLLPIHSPRSCDTHLPQLGERTWNTCQFDFFSPRVDQRTDLTTSSLSPITHHIFLPSITKSPYIPYSFICSYPPSFPSASPPPDDPAMITFFSYVARLPVRGDIGVVTGRNTTHAFYWCRVSACLRKGG